MSPDANSDLAAFGANALCAGMSAADIAAVHALAECVSFVKGARIVRQGEASRGAWLLRVGTAEARVTLSAGGEQTVAVIPANGYFGETALLDRGQCNANVVATENVDGWFLERDAFRALAASRNPAALALQRTLTATLAARVSALNAALFAQPAPEDRPPRAGTESGIANIRIETGAAFAWRGFLHRLAFFEGFSENEIDAVVADRRPVTVRRGDALFSAGEPASACYLVMRGAVEVLSRSPTRERRVALLGPGTLVGYLSVLAGKPHGADAVAREATTLLEVPAPVFHALNRDASGPAVKVQHAIQRALLQSLARSNSQLSRLVTQARLDAALKAQSVAV
ncbi:MAG: cyclic nucleotide-binding domain-containing protein [Betaproteobacteria bacterium]|nr:cyclic nucleotide-binding domain-containing protein [Betaproteobacteria bacterium]